MVQKYIAVFLVFMLSSMAAAPAFAGDYTNTKLLPHRLPLSVSASAALATSAAIPARTTFSEMAGTLAFAPQQPGQPQPQATSPSKGELTTAGKVMKWVGIALMAGGAADVAAGAVVSNSNSCAGSSNCLDLGSIARPVYYASGGVSIGIGAVLLIVGLHKRE